MNAQMKEIVETLTAARHEISCCNASNACDLIARLDSAIALCVDKGQLPLLKASKGYLLVDAVARGALIADEFEHLGYEITRVRRRKDGSWVKY